MIRRNTVHRTYTFLSGLTAGFTIALPFGLVAPRCSPWGADILYLHR